MNASLFTTDAYTVSVMPCSYKISDLVKWDYSYLLIVQ